MNLSYLKYAVEVEKTGSITKAAQNFYMNQPHLSKIIRELERELGCPIFDRTGKGMVPTRKGDEFLRCAKAILIHEEQLQSLCVKNSRRILSVSLSVPRASYISYGFTEYLKNVGAFPSVSLHYKETNSRDTIQSVSSKAFDLGIIRCQSLYEGYYLKMLQESNLDSKELWEFSCNVLMSPSHSLAQKEKLTYLDFAECMEVAWGDIQNPSFAYETQDVSAAAISIYDRGTQLELLRRIPDAYMWTSPVPEEYLHSMGLIQRQCCYPGNLHKDILIYRNGHCFTKDERAFLQCLFEVISRLGEG